MWSVSDIIRLVTIFSSLVSGLTLNSYIITAYVREWRKRKSINVCDKIVILLALTGIIHQCNCIIEGLQYFFGSYPQNGRTLNVYGVAFNLFLVCDGFWNTAWLSIYYFLKLVKCSHHIFLQIKRRLSSSITQILIVSLVGLFFISLPLPWTLQILYKNMTNNPSGIYVTHPYLHIDLRYIPLYMVLGCLLPFLLIFICIGLSVMSLLSHVQQIRQNSSQFGSSPQLEGHLRAVRTMILQVCLYLALYLSLCSLVLFSINIGTMLKAFIFIVIKSYPSSQAVISIHGNPKLRNRPSTGDTNEYSK